MLGRVPEQRAFTSLVLLEPDCLGFTSVTSTRTSSVHKRFRISRQVDPLKVGEKASQEAELQWLASVPEALWEKYQSSPGLEKTQENGYVLYKVHMVSGDPMEVREKEPWEKCYPRKLT